MGMDCTGKKVQDIDGSSKENGFMGLNWEKNEK